MLRRGKSFVRSCLSNECNVKKVEDMFKVGDIVEITEESSATGMLDFVDGKGYTVEAVDDTTNAVMLLNESWVARWYHCAHFRLKEGVKLEKKECLFKEGQVVWDLLKGKGVVKTSYHYVQSYPVKVVFEDGDYDYYTDDGKLEPEDKCRRLFFSEPKIEAATEPLFEPTLKAGMIVVALDKETSRFYPMVVREETEEHVTSVHGVVFEKKRNDFLRVGEKIEFN